MRAWSDLASEQCAAGDTGGDEQSINRQSRRATHQRRDENGDEPVLWGFDGARGHDAGNGAGEGTEHRNETFAVQSDFAHQAVHQKRRARHVAGVFEQSDEEEEQAEFAAEKPRPRRRRAMTPLTSRSRRSPGGMALPTASPSQLDTVLQQVHRHWREE